MEFDAFLDELTARSAAARDGAGGVGPWGRNLMVVRRVASTNALGRRILDELGREGVRLPVASLVAWEQVDGRGRHGATWQSPAGRGAYVSVLRPVADPAELPTLPLLAPVAVARAVNRFLGDERCRIKWPNDLLVDGRKIAGVLIAGVTGRLAGDDGGGNGISGTGIGGTGIGGAVIGVGVNHGQDEAELAGVAPRGATSLALLADRPPSLAELVWALLESLAEELVHAGDGAAAVERYEALSLHEVGERLRCRAADGSLEGTFLGFDRRGFLRLALTSSGAGRRCGDEVLVTAGEVVSP